MQTRSRMLPRPRTQAELQLRAQLGNRNRLQRLSRNLSASGLKRDSHCVRTQMWYPWLYIHKYLPFLRRSGFSHGKLGCSPIWMFRVLPSFELVSDDHRAHMQKCQIWPAVRRACSHLGHSGFLHDNLSCFSSSLLLRC